MCVLFLNLMVNSDRIFYFNSIKSNWQQKSDTYFTVKMSTVKLVQIMSEMVMTLCYMVLPVNLFVHALTITYMYYHSSTGWGTFDFVWPLIFPPYLNVRNFEPDVISSNGNHAPAYHFWTTYFEIWFCIWYNTVIEII